MPHKVTVSGILDKKKNNEKIACLTAYDAPTAFLLDNSGIDIVLVGDSLGNVVLGFEGTRQVTIEDMVRHTRAVRSKLDRALLVSDLTYDSFRKGDALIIKNALRLKDEAGAEAVKIEGAVNLEAIKKMILAGIPVMGHLGYLPQTGLEPRMFGKDGGEFRGLLDDAKALQSAGVFSIVLEMVDHAAAEKITEALDVPTIGIGSGPLCGGQILVTHDMVGLYPGRPPKFVKQYADLGSEFKKAVGKYADDVKSGRYPSETA